MIHHFYCKVGKIACTIFFLVFLGTRKKINTLLTAVLKTSGRNGWLRNIINDGDETSARKFQARFQIIHVSSSAEHRVRLE